MIPDTGGQVRDDVDSTIPTPREFSRTIRQAIRRPNRVMAPVRWYGGKGNLVKRILPFVPETRIYCEPYCGAASLFWHLPKPRSVEVLNDLNGEIINLWRVLQNEETFERLVHRLTWTPYSLAEFRKALKEESSDPVDQAWAFFVRQNQGFAGLSNTEGRWGRTFIEANGVAETANRWRGRLACLDAWHQRLSRVQLDERDAIEVIQYWDSENTFFYCDPPYATSTRVDKQVYRHECDEAHHAKLVETLLSLKAQVILSGYETPIYKPLQGAGWRVIKIETACYAANRNRGSKIRGEGSALRHASRTEVLWIKVSGDIGGLWGSSQQGCPVLE